MKNPTLTPFRLSAACLGLAACLCAQPCPAPSTTVAPTPFVNDICLPSALYMLADTPNDVFVQPFLKRWRPYNDFVRFAMKDKNAFSRRLSHVATVSKPTDGAGAVCAHSETTSPRQTAERRGAIDLEFFMLLV